MKNGVKFFSIFGEKKRRNLSLKNLRKIPTGTNYDFSLVYPQRPPSGHFS